jgi:cbb3-type cytochrome oxidase maturation protein
MEWIFYTVAFLIAIALSGTAVYALYWSSKNGQLRDFERGAQSIFDEQEPVGRMTDHFPERRRRAMTVGPGGDRGQPDHRSEDSGCEPDPKLKTLNREP